MTKLLVTLVFFFCSIIAHSQTLSQRQWAALNGCKDSAMLFFDFDRKVAYGLDENLHPLKLTKKRLQVGPREERLRKVTSTDSLFYLVAENGAELVLINKAAIASERIDAAKSDRVFRLESSVPQPFDRFFEFHEDYLVETYVAHADHDTTSHVYAYRLFYQDSVNLLKLDNYFCANIFLKKNASTEYVTGFQLRNSKLDAYELNPFKHEKNVSLEGMWTLTNGSPMHKFDRMSFSRDSLKLFGGDGLRWSTSYETDYFGRVIITQLPDGPKEIILRYRSGNEIGFHYGGEGLYSFKRER